MNGIILPLGKSRNNAMLFGQSNPTSYLKPQNQRFCSSDGSKSEFSNRYDSFKTI